MVEICSAYNTTTRSYVDTELNATDLNTARADLLTDAGALIISSAVTVSVKTYGAKGDGITDDTLAIQAAATAVGAAGGGVLLFPATANAAGYIFSKPIIVSSNTIVRGNGYASRLIPVANWTPSYTSNLGLSTANGWNPNYNFFINKNWAAVGITDTNIVLESLYLDCSPVPASLGGGFQSIALRMASHCTVRNCTVNSAANGSQFLACDDTESSGNRMLNMIGGGLEWWEGNGHARAINNYIQMVPADTGAIAIEYSGGATNQTPTQASKTFICTGNMIVGAGNYAAAIICDAVFSGSTSNFSIIAHNIIDLTTAPATGGIVTSGGNGQHTISNNTLIGGLGVSAIAITPISDAVEPVNCRVADNKIINWNTGSSSVPSIVIFNAQTDAINGVGAGGTNGTFALSFTGGGGTGIAGNFVVSGGKVVSMALTSSGSGYSAPPVPSFDTCPGLTGADGQAQVLLGSNYLLSIQGNNHVIEGNDAYGCIYPETGYIPGNNCIVRSGNMPTGTSGYRWQFGGTNTILIDDDLANNNVSFYGVSLSSSKSITAPVLQATGGSAITAIPATAPGAATGWGLSLFDGYAYGTAASTNAVYSQRWTSGFGPGALPANNANTGVPDTGASWSLNNVTGLAICKEYQVGGATGPAILTYARAPNTSDTQPIGSIFINTAGAAGSHIYVAQGGGVWNAISGV